MIKGRLISILSYCVLALFLFLVPLIISHLYIIHILILTAINVILASSLRFINLSGHLSLAHGGMMAIGAYTSTLLVMNLGFSYWLTLLLAGIFAAVIACLVGFPFVRIKGVYFAMVTLFLAAIVTTIAEQWQSLTGGTVGITNIPRPDPIIIPGLLNITFSSKVDFYYLIVFIMLVSLIIMYSVEHSRIGLILRGIQQSDSLAESVGINTTGYKVLAFCIGCFFASLTGGFYAHYISSISPRVFGFLFTINIVVYMIVGGSGRFAGPILGALILSILPEVLRPLQQYVPFFFSAVLILVIFFMPEGIVGLPERLKKLVLILSGKMTKRA